MDPDTWEFASEWFLRGQRHLLKNIIRRKHTKNPYLLQNKQMDEEEDEEEEMLMEIARLKQEQKDMEMELQLMNKRLEATERRPQQMMNFLYKLADNPEILPRLVFLKEQNKRLFDEKKRRLMISSLSLSPQTSSSYEAELGVFSSFSTSENQLHELSPSPETPCNSGSSRQGRFIDHNLISQQPYNFAFNSFWYTSSVGDIDDFSVAPTEECLLKNDNSGGKDVGYFGRMGGRDEYSPPPYPFSLFGGGF